MNRLWAADRHDFMDRRATDGTLLACPAEYEVVVHDLETGAVTMVAMTADQVCFEPLPTASEKRVRALSRRRLKIFWESDPRHGNVCGPRRVSTTEATAGARGNARG